ncbi:LysM peptidoglycan-binding domain-containing protein [Paenibacillus sinopodophylli]|uniref:LysM peptidoglycan-binding domain-containing protein n=1 Tax=Paenibacillus sinopodophylli TaxID=1837342 RepID=UPI001BB22D8C|nr:LysM peptidoglycan-binding domain-containing protein [Paenibacillus sinopodophylli]
MIKYEIWLSYNNKEDEFQLPVNPGKIEIADGTNSKTFDVIGLGEVSTLLGRKLSEVSFSGFFPSLSARAYKVGAVTADPFVSADTQLEPKAYVEYIEKWMVTRRPIRFIFNGGSFGINMAASIESFDWSEVAGGGGDIEYSIKLKQYIFYGPKKYKVVTAEATKVATLVDNGKERPNEKQTPKTYTLRSGDSLWKVAKTQLGDGARWKEIQTLNKIPDAKLKSLSIGTVLQLPTVKGAASSA